MLSIAKSWISLQVTTKIFRNIIREKNMTNKKVKVQVNSDLLNKSHAIGAKDNESKDAYANRLLQEEIFLLESASKNKKAKVIKKTVTDQITDSVTQAVPDPHVNPMITDSITQANLKWINDQITDSVTQLFGSIKRSITHSFERVRYISKLVPFFWRNYWWDHSTLDEFLVLELRRRSKYFKSLGLSVDALKCANEMDKVADGIEVFLSSSLENEFSSKWENKYPGFFNTKWESLLTPNSNIYESFSDENENVALSKTFAKEYTKVTQKQYKIRRDALLLFAKNSEKWWD